MSQINLNYIWLWCHPISSGIPFEYVLSECLIKSNRLGSHSLFLPSIGRTIKSKDKIKLISNSMQIIRCFIFWMFEIWIFHSYNQVKLKRQSRSSKWSFHWWLRLMSIDLSVSKHNSFNLPWTKLVEHQLIREKKGFSPMICISGSKRQSLSGN